MTKHSPDSNPKGPLPLQESTSRLVQSLANSSFASTRADADRNSETDDFALSPDVVREFIRAWQERGRHLPAELLSDPAWGMLLELFHAELGHRTVSLSMLCESSGTPVTTAVRWLRALENHHLVIHRAAHEIGEESVELSPEGSSALHRYFRAILHQK